MRIISANINGIRAAAKKGFFDWLKKVDPDVVCIQETKAQFHQLTDEVFSPKGYFCEYHDAEKKGYSGVAIYSKVKPKKIIKGIGCKRVTQPCESLPAEPSPGTGCCCVYGGYQHQQE